MLRIFTPRGSFHSKCRSTVTRAVPVVARALAQAIPPVVLRKKSLFSCTYAIFFVPLHPILNNSPMTTNSMFNFTPPPYREWRFD